MVDRDMLLNVHAKKLVMEPGRDAQAVCKGCGEPWPCSGLQKARQERS